MGKKELIFLWFVFVWIGMEYFQGNGKENFVCCG